ncbi:MAG TPA: DUF4097 family beta strand repeat-containing protein [Acidimicrobiales bacterium]
MTKRTPLQRIVIGLSVLLALAFIGAGAVQAASGIVIQSKDASRTVVGPVSSIRVNVDGDVQVKAGPDGQVTMATHQVWSFQRPTVTEKRTGADLSITASCPGVSFGSCSTSLRLSVPAGSSLDLTSQDSNISVADVQGALTLHSDNGDVDVGSASGPLHLSSGNGDVIGADLTSSQVQASSSNGDVVMTFTGAPETVTATSENGNATVGLPRGPDSYLVSATTDNGNHSVGVHTNSASDRHIVVSSQDGDVAVNYAP